MLLSDIIDVEAEGIVLDARCTCESYGWDFFADTWRDRYGGAVLASLPFTCVQCGDRLLDEGCIIRYVEREARRQLETTE